MFSFQTLLVLSRVASLPTVWSNCLIGWWLGGGGDFRRLPGLFVGVSFIYIAGGFLNDAIDAVYDREHRRSRPIPSGAISREAVLVWGWAWLGLGLLCLFWVGAVAGGLGIVLACGVLVHNWSRRVMTFSPVILGVCRFFVYIIGASVAASGVTGWAIWCGLAVAFYVAGAGYLARLRRPLHAFPFWQVACLVAPILLALIMDNGSLRTAGLLLSFVLALWLLRCLRRLYSREEGDLAALHSGLFAGIVLVDWLAAADGPRALNLVFIALFLFTLLLQSLLPAD